MGALRFVQAGGVKATQIVFQRKRRGLLLDPLHKRLQTLSPIRLVLPRSEPDKQEDWEKTLFALEVGAYNKTPIKIKDRFLVAKITEKRAGRDQPFADVRTELKEELFVRRLYDEEYPKWVKKLRESYKIDIKLDLPN